MSNITMLAVGTRGDVQPAIALGKGLQAAGHAVRVLASANFCDWIEAEGLAAGETAVDLQALMASAGGQKWVEEGYKPLVQLRVMRALLEEVGMEMIVDAWRACQDADLIVSSFTSDMYAVAFGQKLGVPVVSMPLQPPLVATRDGRALVNAPLPGRVGLINWLFGKFIVERAPWQMYGDIVNRFRQEVLQMPLTSHGDYIVERRQMVTLCAFSGHVVPTPDDWPAHFHTTGYFFLNNDAGWEPPPLLRDFLQAGPPPVAVGFGSMIGKRPERFTRLLVDAIRQSGQRAVLLSGWAGLGETELPETVLRVTAVPHDWLYPQMAAVVHHGGAGTTAAGLRAGVPAVIVPHMADQFYWAQRLHALGVSPPPLPRHKLTAANLAAAIEAAATDTDMQARAKRLATGIAVEDGVAAAVAIINQQPGVST